MKQTLLRKLLRTQVGSTLVKFQKKVKYSSQSRAVKEKLNKQTKDLCWSTLEQDYERREVSEMREMLTLTLTIVGKIFSSVRWSVWRSVGPCIDPSHSSVVCGQCTDNVGLSSNLTLTLTSANS